MTSAIDTLIEKEEFTHWSQNIYQTNDLEKIGEEYLFRGSIGNPEVIFNKARERNRLFELDMKSIYRAVSTFFQKIKSTILDRLFLNIFPSTILHPTFTEYMEELIQRFPLTKKNIVLEIIESEKVTNMELLKERVIFLKELGFKIAIDDVGKGWSSLLTIIELEPNYIKLDRYFSMNLSKTRNKQKMIKTLKDYVHRTPTNIVLEGIERVEDLYIAQNLGVPLCQGYLLDKPQPVI